MKQHKFIKPIAATLAATLGVGVVGVTLANTDNSMAKAVDFSTGNYDLWDGVTYTFDWYENPTTNSEGVTVYTIDSASDLAGLSIVTNDLSNTDWSSLTANVTDTQYISLVDNFEGDIIEITVDVDLGTNAWLPISYAWKTPNLTSNYEMINLNGETVKYNAVDHIADQTVDPWVGDINGDPISTRYWEYPESELRFRDYTKELTKHSHMDVVKEEKDLGSPMLYRIYTAYAESTGYNVPDIVRDTYHRENLNYNREMRELYYYKDIKGFHDNPSFAGTINGNDKKIKGLRPSTPWTTDTTARLTTYDPLGKGFIGVLGEKGSLNDLNIQGTYTDAIMSYSAVGVAYNYGTINDVYIDCEDIRQSLISQIYPIKRDYAPGGNSTYELSGGSVMPIGFSGITTAVNYGTISNSYCVGLVTKCFRTFGSFAALNYGTIDSCVNKASISNEEFVTTFTTDEYNFGDMTNEDTWHFINYATYCKRLFNDDTESYGHALMGRSGIWEWWVTIYGLSLRPTADTSERPWHKNPLDFGTVSSLDSNVLTGFYVKVSDEASNATTNLDVCVASQLDSNLDASLYGHTTTWGTDNIHDLNDRMWIAPLYNTTAGESVAANHLYGVFEQTNAGGIAALNYGTIKNCSNEGNIKPLYGTSARNTVRVNDTSLNYIRPTNEYGIFCTATDVVCNAGGIAGLNFSKIEECYATGDVQPRKLTDAEKQEGLIKSNIMAISATANGWYQNGVKVDTTPIAAVKAAWPHQAVIDWCDAIEADPHNIYGYDWWVIDSDSTVINQTDTNGEKYTYFDRDMPYPFATAQKCKTYQNPAGVAGFNMGTISDTTHTSESLYGFCVASNGTSPYSEKAGFYGCTQDVTEEYDHTNRYDSYSDIPRNSNFAVLMVDTDFDDNIIKSAAGKHSVVLIEGDSDREISAVCEEYIQEDSALSISNNNYIKGHNYFIENIKGKDDLRIKFHNNVFNNEIQDRFAGGGSFWESATGIDIDTVYINTPCKYALGYDTEAGYINNIYMLSFMDRGIGYNTNFNTGENWYIVPDFGPEVPEGETDYSTSMYECTGNLANGTLTNLQVYNFGLGSISAIGSFYNCDVSNVKIYSDLQYTAIIGRDSKFSDVFILGDSSVVNNSVYSFTNCELINFDSQLDPTLVIADYKKQGTVQSIPQLLHSIADNTTFVDSTFICPSGMMSFSSFNILVKEEAPLAGSEAYIVKDPNARENGALAYYKDKGWKADRTTDYTVAFNDTLNTFDVMNPVIPNAADYAHLKEYDVPVYTRAKISNDEPHYYKYTIPMLARGAGTLKASVERNGVLHETDGIGLMYRVEDLYVIEGEEINLEVDCYDTHQLIGINRTVNGVVTEIPSDNPGGNYEHSKEVVGAYDALLEPVWGDTYNIEVHKSVGDYMIVTPDCTKSLAGESISLDIVITTDDYAIDDLYWCGYTLDKNNRRIIDRDNKHPIDMQTLKFVMPEEDIVILCDTLSNYNDIFQFALAGVYGVIDGSDITIKLEDSIDVRAIKPDTITISDKATISPSIDEVQDFSKPVSYTVTAESGAKQTYIVKVIPLSDGSITDMIIYGQHGTINGTNIKFVLPSTTDVTAITPKITWEGANLSWDQITPIDFTNPYELTVTSSSGEDVTYTVTIELTTEEILLNTIKFNCESAELVSVIDHDNKLITVEYPYGMDVSSVVVVDMGFIGDNSTIKHGDSINLTVNNAILLYNEDGTVAPYTVVATELPSTTAQITQFVLYGIEGIIDGNNITVTVPSKYDITNIQPDVVTFTGKMVSNPYTRQNFTEQISYAVTSYSGDVVVYTVTVKQED